MSSVDTKNKGMGKEVIQTTSLLSGSLTLTEQEATKVQERRWREALEKKKLQKTGSSCVYMFASLHSGNAGYVLYKINYQDLNETPLSYGDNNKIGEETPLSDNNNNKDKDMVESYTPLTPLVVFYTGDLPDNFCSLVPLGDYLYFVGQAASDVFKIKKSSIETLTPNETNCGSDYLEPVLPHMYSPKYQPFVFVAKANLYVISIDDDDYDHLYQFEMYSPSENQWTVLNYRPVGPYGPFKSHVVLDDTVFFATYDGMDAGDHNDSVLSYNITHDSWKHLTTSPHNLHPAFNPPVFSIGDMLLGGFSPCFIPRSRSFTVAASPYSNPNASDMSMFMRPTLAPQQSFWLEFNRHRQYVSLKASHYMTHLRTSDGQNVLCLVTYGLHPTSEDTVAFFNFFTIGCGTHTDPPVPLKEQLLLEDSDDCCYYPKQLVSSVSLAKSYFKSEFMHRKLFKISTEELLIYPGTLITLF